MADNFLTRLGRAFPIFREIKDRDASFIRQAVVAGDVADAELDCDGIDVGDQIAGVFDITNSAMLNRTTFTITKSGTVTTSINTDATNLLITYIDWT